MKAAERRPPSAAPSDDLTDEAAASVPRRTENRQRTTPFLYWLRFECNRRRREWAEFKAILHEPADPLDALVEPIRDFANELVQVHGFDVDEVAALLNLEPVR